ncbi:hypothetical protein LEN26_003473, partial [Aphanomyces euteiches]
LEYHFRFCFRLKNPIMSNERLSNATQQELNSMLLETVAAADENVLMVQDLLSYGADANAKDNEGNTPLHIAAKNGYVNTTMELLGRNADVEEPNNNGWRPLHFASKNGNQEVVKLLMDEGADPLAKTKIGQTAFELGDFFVQAVFEKYYPMPTSKLSIKTAVMVIKKFLVDTKYSTLEIITVSTSIMTQALKFQIHRQIVLTTGVMIERIVRNFLRSGSPIPNQASKLLSLLKEMESYLSVTFAMTQSWKLPLSEISDRPEIQNIFITMTHFQDQLIKTVNYRHVNLAVDVISNYDDLRDDFATTIDIMENFEEKLKDIAKDSKWRQQEAYINVATLLRLGLARYDRQIALGNITPLDEFEGHARSCLQHVESFVENCRDIIPTMDELDLIDSWTILSDDLKFDKDKTSILGYGPYATVFKGKYRDQLSFLDSGNLIVEEIKTWSTISNESYILSLIGVCTSSPQPVILSELYQTNIRRYVRDRPEFLLPMVYQFALGLASIHRANIIHRDIKGDNILITYQRTVAIADFGLACFYNNEIKHPRAGTLNWMSPDQFFGTQPLTKKTDIWSFGMTVWEIICNDIPFRDCSAREFEDEIFKSEDDRPEKPGHLNPKLEPLWTLINKCWQLDPVARPSPDEVIEFLKHHYPHLDTDLTITQSTEQALGLSRIPVETVTIRFAMELIRQTWHDTTENTMEIIKTASAILDISLKSKIHRESVLTTGLMVQRIVHFMLNESTVHAPAILLVLSEIRNYWEKSLQTIQVWKMQVSSNQNQETMKEIRRNITQLQQRLIEASNGLNVLLDIQVVGDIDDIKNDIVFQRSLNHGVKKTA